MWMLVLTLVAQDHVDFSREIAPILESRCYECHAAEYKGRKRKPKGGLRLDSGESILRGPGGGKKVVVPGKPEASELYRRISLPEDHEDVMPPDGETLPPEQRELIRRWIAEGAVVAGTETLQAGKPPIEGAPARPAGPDRFEIYRSLGEGLAPVPASAISKVIAETGADIEAVFPGSPLLRVEYISDPTLGTDKALAAMAPLRRNIAILGLGFTKVTDLAVPEIGKMPLLVRLDLQRTALTDRGLDSLGKLALKDLRRLNLYGTAITDAGIPALASLPSLEALYLWDTKTTQKAQSMLPPRVVAYGAR